MTEKELRAQWIRDAARDILIAHLSVGAERAHYRDPDKSPHEGAWSIADFFWEKYEQERK